MSKRFEARRTHGSFAELVDAKPIAFRDCLDCGKKIYTRMAKRCNACAHAMKKEQSRKAGLTAASKRKERQTAAYFEMLRILGIREHQGDCI